MNAAASELEYFFSPRSIAIIGASGNFDIISGKPLRFLKEHGFRGRIFPVNPKYEELGGYRCYKSVIDVPEPVDLALIAVNYRLVLPVLKECVKKGVKFATIFSSGFAETGDEGRNLQEQISELCKASGIRVCGPNCQGSVNLKEKVIGGFSASLGVKPLLVGPIGFVTQSGALGYSIFGQAQESGVGFTYVASTGNEVDLHTLDFMEYILEDPDTKMLIAYLEGIKDGRQFIRIADRALELGKPIVVLKVGRSEIGKKAATSHTASMTGSDAVCDAFFRQKGIIRVEDIENMIDIAALMQRVPELPNGRGLGIVTTSGGGGILVADEAVDLRLEIPELDPGIREAISTVIPDYGSTLNPVDVTAQVINEAEDFMKVLNAVIDDPDIHALVIVVTQIIGEPGMQMAADIVKISRSTRKPLTVAWTASDKLVGKNLKILKEGDVQYYKSPLRAVRAMGALMNYAAFRERYLSRASVASTRSSHSDNYDEAISILFEAGASLTEHKAKELLGLYDIPVTKEEIATSKDRALRIAERIGYPVALKIDSPDILHKTEADCIRLNIKNPEELVASYREVLQNARQHKPNASLRGVLVQEMVSGGTEVIVGVNNDSQFGPTVMFGIGGIFVEILNDVSLRVAPLTREDALEMIGDIKGSEILYGARGRTRTDIDALADVLVKVGAMAIDLEDSFVELDINPLLVLPEGKGVKAVDALVIRK